MDTIQEGIRDGAIHRGRLDRLACAECDRELGLVHDSDSIGTVMACPECDGRWVKL